MIENINDMLGIATVTVQPRNPMDFKIRCSKIGTIMSNAKTKGELSQTCKTYLEEWLTGEHEEFHSKYIEKGHYVEQEVLDMAADELGFMRQRKNEVSMSDEYFTGTCDVDFGDVIVDVKSAWNLKTLRNIARDGADSDHIWQGRGYMRLYNRPAFVVFHGLVDTPEEVNFGREVQYSHLPQRERWIAFRIERDLAIESAIIERVIQCREYLVRYQDSISNRLGKLHQL